MPNFLTYLKTAAIICTIYWFILFYEVLHLDTTLGGTEGTNVFDAPVRDERATALPRRVEHEPRNIPVTEKSSLEVADQSHTSYILYRSIGNDLPPRHSSNQSLHNLEFILQNEPMFANVSKMFILNRIVDDDKEQQALLMLEKYRVPSIVLPFSLYEYSLRPFALSGFPTADWFRSKEYRYPKWDLQQERAVAYTMRWKNIYAMNVNGARNVALRDGQPRAKFVLPFDGNCFFNRAGWRALSAGPDVRYTLVPEARITDNALALDDGFTPRADEEPQIMFRHDAKELFDETIMYGRRPKVEMFYRLGYPGKWDKWGIEPWEKKTSRRAVDGYKDAKAAGFVMRLWSGVRASNDVDTGGTVEAGKKADYVSRDGLRLHGIRKFLLGLDERVARELYGLDPETSTLLLTTQGVPKLSPQSTARPLSSPRSAACKSATVKMSIRAYLGEDLPDGVGSDPDDYWADILSAVDAEPLTPLPAASLRAMSLGGRPFSLDSAKFSKEDVRLRASDLYAHPTTGSADAVSDAELWRRVVGRTTLGAHSWLATCRTDILAEGAELIRLWFVDPLTRMPPHLDNVPSSAHDEAVLLFASLPVVLDAARLAHAANLLTLLELAELRQWCTQYLAWLQSHHELGRRPWAVGLAYDVQVAGLSFFVGDWPLFLETLHRAPMRATVQAAALRPVRRDFPPMDDVLCALMYWAELATMGARLRFNVWNTAVDGRSPLDVLFITKALPWGAVSEAQRARYLASATAAVQVLSFLRHGQPGMTEDGTMREDVGALTETQVNELVSCLKFAGLGTELRGVGAALSVPAAAKTLGSEWLSPHPFWFALPPVATNEA